jgi:hypothetical protein
MGLGQLIRQGSMPQSIQGMSGLWANGTPEWAEATLTNPAVRYAQTLDGVRFGQQPGGSDNIVAQEIASQQVTRVLPGKIRESQATRVSLAWENELGYAYRVCGSKSDGGVAFGTYQAITLTKAEFVTVWAPALRARYVSMFGIEPSPSTLFGWAWQALKEGRTLAQILEWMEQA